LVLLQRLLAFKKENAMFKRQSGRNYRQKKMNLLASFETSWDCTRTGQFAKQQGWTSVKITIAVLQVSRHGEKLDDFIDLADDICGIAQYIQTAEVKLI